MLNIMVYNGGESTDSAKNFSGSNILGYIILKAPKVRVTAVPGFDTSYKSAATNAITLSTMEPENDKPAYTITFVKNA